MTEEKIDTEAVVEAPKAEDNLTAAPAENKEAEEIKKDLDPRIVEIVGEEEITEAFGGKPKESEKPAEEEIKTEAPKEEPKKEGQENPAENKEVEVPKITPPESKPTRLDRRLANRFIRNLHLSGETVIPTEEEVIADLNKYSKEEKIAALHFHLQKEKELRGEKPTGDDLDDEDREAIQDAEKESLRQEIIAEENEKRVMGNFVEFLSKHTYLLPDTPENKAIYPDKKKYDPILGKAVDTLFKRGMQIDEAYETVTAEIQAVKEEHAKKEKKEKDAALSGVLNGSGQVPINEKELDWDAVAKIQEEDPALYGRMLKEGKFKHLI